MLPRSPHCLSPFLLTNTRLPVSALPPQTTAFLQPGPAGKIYGCLSEAAPLAPA